MLINLFYHNHISTSGKRTASYVRMHCHLNGKSSIPSEWEKVWSRLSAHLQPFFQLLARILTMFDKKYRILTCRDKKIVLFKLFCNKTMFRYACELSLTHSGSLWLFLVVSSSLWLSLALTGSLPVSLWLSMALCDSHSGSPWL